MKKYLLLLAVLVLCALAGLKGYNYVRDNKMSNFTKTYELYVYPEMSEEEVFEEICNGAGVKNRASLRRAFADKQVRKYLSVGHYTISPENSSVYVARMLNNAWQTPVKVTLSGSLRIKTNIAAKVSSQLLLDSAAVYKALCDDELLSRWGFNSRNVFSLLMPATYEMYWTASVEDFFDKMKAVYDGFWTAERVKKAAALGLSKQEASILASIVTAESNYAPEMPKVAGVYLNRLKIGMLLQADPTVAYCYDYKLNRVLNVHLQVDSPYNTYRHAGLPPGPICVPAREALEAVLNPDFGGAWGKGNLYFCANADFSGTHAFARTLAEHNRNARAFQKELNRRKIMK
ncbi:MAG: endolytic transglycosylase MltG [Bacteroidales bacterium]|nr:endolytic transglycosylase MltG [Bacteroidales bacterium]